jgi:hypothetical protein
MISKLPSFDAKTFSEVLSRHLNKPDGSPYLVFDQIKPFIDGIRKLRDQTAANDVFLNDVKQDLDAYRAKTNDRVLSLEQRVTDLEGRTSTVPFPGSG